MKAKSPAEYTYEFDGVADQRKNGRLHILDHQAGHSSTIYVWIDDTRFLQLRGLQIPAPVADLMDLAIAIYEADRWSLRHNDFPCIINVRLPIRSLSIFSQPEVHDLLSRLLHWYTGDCWQFEFSPFLRQRRLAELQQTFWKSSNTGVQAEVALWSGGLDALAGLCNRFKEQSAERYLLFGAASNPLMRGIQQEVFTHLQERSKTDLNLMQLAIFQRGVQEVGLQRDEQLRARGLVFMLLGCAYASLEDQHELYLYENAIGAINLPYRASEVGLDHARSVHPLSLHYLSQVVSIILGKPFTVINPFDFWTKAEMCSVLPDFNAVDIAWRTISCDRNYHRKDFTQCGRCSSCILRRESLLAAGLPDDTQYLVHTESGGALHRLLSTSHLPHMHHQVTQLSKLLPSPDAWSTLAREHPSLLADLVTKISNDTDQPQRVLAQRIISMYQRYTDEWSQPSVRSIFEAEIDAIKQMPRLTKQAQEPTD